MTSRGLLYLKLFFFRSPVFQHFVKVALTKNPKKRPTAERLLQVIFSVLEFFLIRNRFLIIKRKTITHCLLFYKKFR